MTRFLFILIMLIFSSASGLADNYQKNCQEFSAPLKGGFCIYRNITSHNPDVLYYLHGLGGSLESWANEYSFRAQIRKEWAAHGYDAPMVIAISFGETWLLAEKNASPYSGLFDALVYQIIPQIEQSIGGIKGRRLLIGDSMGGFNSIQLAFKTNLFSKVAALCAPMAQVSPFAGEDELKAFIEHSNAWAYYKQTEPEMVVSAVRDMVRLSQAFFPAVESWSKGNPLMLMDRVDATTAPELYLAVGFFDRYAIYEANEMFANRLISRGLKIQWRPQWGGHCAMDIPSLAAFFQ